MRNENPATDIVVAGTGIAGLVSAVRAQEYGGEVIVLEKGTRLGGSTLLSGGYVMTNDDSTYRDSELATSEPLEDGLAWLNEQGVEFDGEIEDEYTGTGRILDTERFVNRMANRIEEQGGEIRLETPLESVVTGEGRSIKGVEARNPDGDPFTIEAKKVILATGGFQGNERLVEQFITENTDNLYLRGNPWSTGDGLLTALDLGAKTTSGFAKFDGHNMVAPPATFTSEQFSDASQYFGPWGVAVDQQGNRFTDESLHPLETPLLQDVAKRADGRAYFIADRSLYESTVVFDRHVGSIIERAAEFGGNVITGDSLAAFGKALDRAGVDGEQTVDTLITYNRAVRETNGEQLNPPRTKNQEPLDTPPFYAVPVQPGIHFTFGGLDINEHGQVLARSASSSSLSQHAGEKEAIEAPIEGLYAAGVDIGNPDRRYYIGGLAQGLASGRTAGKHAAVSLQQSSKK